jgi:hypothetical protein
LVVITDNGSEFRKDFEQLCGSLGLEQIRTATYHPEANAPIETFHRHLKKCLMQFRAEDDKDFVMAIHLAVYMYRSLPHLGTGETPAFALFGTDLRPARTLDWRSVPYPPESDRLKFLLSARQEIAARATMRAAQLQEKYDRERRPVQFRLGDLVIVRKVPKDKLTPSWTLPYRVIAVDRKGTTATLRHILFDKLKSGVHISNCRFLNQPVSDEQQQAWDRLVRQELKGVPSRVRKRALSRLDDVKPLKSVRLTVGGESVVPETVTVSHTDSDVEVVGDAPPLDPVRQWWCDEL